MFKKDFLVFHYLVDGQMFIEAYPINLPLDYLLGSLPPEIVKDCEVVIADSRNQARKSGYCKWVDKTGNGFNRMEYRINGRK